MEGLFVLAVVSLSLCCVAETVACTLFNAEPGPVGMTIEAMITHIRGPRCPICGQRKHSVESRRRDARYNFSTCCTECYDDECEWHDMWRGK